MVVYLLYILYLKYIFLYHCSFKVKYKISKFMTFSLHAQWSNSFMPYDSKGYAGSQWIKSWNFFSIHSNLLFFFFFFFFFFCSNLHLLPLVSPGHLQSIPINWLLKITDSLDWHMYPYPINIQPKTLKIFAMPNLLSISYPY